MKNHPSLRAYPRGNLYRLLHFIRNDRKIEILFLTLIVVLALVLRLYKIDNPIADWHSWRQADTASVTRVMIQEGINLLTPRYQDISSIPSGKGNPNGYRMVEWPLYNLLHLAVYRANPSLGVDQAGRLTSVIASLVSLVFLYLIVRKLSGRLPALLTAFLFAVLPFSIYYSRVVLPEPLMITLFLISFYLFLANRRPTLIISAVFLALALLVKPYALFFTLPYLYWWWINRKRTKISPWWLLFFGIIALTPLAAWRLWISQFPEGIPASAWLYNNLGIRLRPAWFRWLFGVRYGNLILGYWGILPFGLGLLSLKKTAGWIYRLFLVGVIAYLVIFAGGNVQHDYYQAISLPFVAIILAVGFSKLINPEKQFSRVSGAAIAVFCLGLMLGLSWYEIKGYYQINNPAIVEAGQAADKLLPKDAKVIASYNGDTAFLYQTNRFGWPAITTDLKTMIGEAKNVYYVTVNFDSEANRILADPHHQVIEKTDKLLIVKLFAK